MLKVNSIQRFRQIMMILAKYGFGYIIDSKIKNSKSSPENLRKAFEELGPTFIKIGQILSTRPDILPYPYIVELQKLQDNTNPVEYSIVEIMFFNEFKNHIDNIFMYFEKMPLASASIAQVHRAILNDGRVVIVKIQRPEIEEYMKLDMSILKKMVHLTHAKFQDALIDPKEAIDEILIATQNELDFQREALSADKFKNLNKDIKFVNSPVIVHEFTSKKILTMEYISGIKITDKSLLIESGYDLPDIGKKLALAYFKQIFQDGFFHGDPHPGNIIIKDNQIYFIDFGIMGTLSPSLIELLNEILISIAFKDIDMLVSSLLSIGIKKGYVDRNKLYEDIDYLFENYLTTSLQNIKISTFLEDTFNTAAKHNIAFPKGLTLLIKGIVIIEGVIAEIAPDVKFLDIAIHYTKSTNKLKLIPNMDEFLLSVYAMSREGKQLPSKFLKLINNALAGRLKMLLEIKDVSKHMEQMNKMVNRLVFSLIVSALIISSSFILNTNIGPRIYGISLIGVTGFLTAGFLGLYLLISIIRSGKL